MWGAVEWELVGFRMRVGGLVVMMHVGFVKLVWFVGWVLMVLGWGVCVHDDATFDMRVCLPLACGGNGTIPCRI